MKQHLAILSFCLCVSAFSQTVMDKSSDRTHKKQHDRTPYFRMVNGKRMPCGMVAEMKGGSWKDFYLPEVRDTPSQLFDTKADAVKFMVQMCPLAGKAGHD